MQSQYTNFVSRMAYTEELNDFQHDTVIGCIPFQQVSSSNFSPARAERSTVTSVIVKWKRLGAATAQPRSGRPHKLTEWDR